jgi:NADPH:quinone reductase-like Zn-dependent oxidoreductase
MEFSGRNQKGQRVMGMIDSGSLSTMVLADKTMMWNVPDCWTLEDAVTVPMGYGTVSCCEVNPKFGFYKYLAVLPKWENLCPSILKSVCL